MPAPPDSRRVSRGGATSELRAICTRLATRFAALQCRAAFTRLSISARLILLVLGLALPLNLVIVGVIWDLVGRANEVQRTSLLYAARSIAAGVDAELGKYVTLAEALSRSPALLDDISICSRPRRVAHFRSGQMPGFWSPIQMASSS